MYRSLANTGHWTVKGGEVESNQDAAGPKALGNKNKAKEYKNPLGYIVYALQM